MFHHVIALIALGVGGADAYSQGLPGGYHPHEQVHYSAQPRDARYGVEFRQPDWREYAFGSPQEMEDFIYEKQRNGWDVQILSGQLRVRYRLVQWGGSRVLDSFSEARAWAAHLERQFGYETRIVDHP